jgi:hypothetical protein
MHTFQKTEHEIEKTIKRLQKLLKKKKKEEDTGVTPAEYYEAEQGLAEWARKFRM